MTLDKVGDGMGQGPGTVGLNQPAELIEANTEVSWGGGGCRVFAGTSILQNWRLIYDPKCHLSCSVGSSTHLCLPWFSVTSLGY